LALIAISHFPNEIQQSCKVETLIEVFQIVRYNVITI
jgi:hypothetical protein